MTIGNTCIHFLIYMYSDPIPLVLDLFRSVQVHFELNKKPTNKQKNKKSKKKTTKTKTDMSCHLTDYYYKCCGSMANCVL